MQKAWTRYEVATGVNKQEQLVRVSTLLSVIGEDAKIAFDAFEWEEIEDDSTREDVLAKFDEYCEPRTQVIYERYRFNNRNQEPGESIASYLTELRTIAKNFQHESITPDERAVVKTTIDLRRLIKNGKYRIISVAEVEQNTQRKIVWHLDRNVIDVEILTTINPFAAPSSLLP